MSNYTRMPPHLSESWDFGPWDNLERDTPPWSHRGFWYHDIDGSGDTLVIAWRWGFDEDGYIIVTGDIYRFNFDNLPAALKFWDGYRKQIDEDNGFGPNGVFMFHGTRSINEPTIYGEPVPPELQNLPDRRWLV